MVDNPKNTTTDDEPFDFGADWGETDPTEGEFNPEDVDFGSGGSAFGDATDNDPFGAASDEDPFASTGDEIFSNASSFEDDSSFDVMPTPDNLSAEMEGEADPDGDFSDISSDSNFSEFNDFENNNSESNSFASHDGFDDTDNLFEADGVDNAFASDDDGFGGQDENVYAEGDAFTSDDETADNASNSTAVEKSGGRGKSILVKAGLAAAVIGIGYVGYTSIVPMFLGSGGQAPVVADANVQPPVNKIPSALPGQDGGLPIPSAEVSGATAPSLPSIPTSQDGGTPPLVSLPDTNVQMVDGNNNENLGSSIPTLNNEPQPVLLPSVEPAPVSQSSEDDLVGGDRGGITALRDQDDAEKSKPVSDVTSAEIKSVIDRIEALETSFKSEINSISNNIDSRLTALEAKMATSPNPTSGITVSTSQSVVSNDGPPPLKPTIIENMSLKGVSRGMAWVKTSTGIIEARVGDIIADGGRVLGITEYNGSWMVSTEKGLILQ
jgi:hypothetical protein